MSRNEVSATSTISPNGRVEEWPAINATALSDSLVLNDPAMREIAGQLSRWVDRARSASSQGMFDRGKYTPPDNPYDEMEAALTAVQEDDIVGGVAEVTEGFAFQGVKWEGGDPDEVDVYNQLSRDLDLDSVIRRMWQQLYGISQFVVATRWGIRDYHVRGKTEDGNKRRKKFTIYAPTSVHILDSRKVVPVGHGPLGGDLLAWCATRGEVSHWHDARAKRVFDPIMEEFFVGQYVPDAQEEAELALLGVDTKNLLVMNPELVWRHTMTKPDYERFAPVRMKGVFKLLDLKQQLINSDRAMLIGAANYILLIRKGSDDMPAKGEELRNLKENYNFIAKLPVIISDHRLEVDIIAPKTDFVLQQERYDLIDTRILMRLLGTLSLGSRGQRNETNVTLSRAVARNMENRRHMLKRFIEREVGRRVYEHPLNARAFDGTEEPNLVYTPRNIALDVDAAMVQAIMALRTQREISRGTILEHFGFDQSVEAQRREMEEDVYDDIFKTAVPFSSPQLQGGQGGRPQGGGDSPNNGVPKDQTTKGNPSTRQAASEDEPEEGDDG
jgi:hypothetical protein